MFRRRKLFKRRKLYRRRKSAARRTYRIAKRAIRRSEEVKWSYVSLTPGWDAANPELLSLQPNIAQGSGQGNRIGNKIDARRYTCRGYLYLSGGTNAPTAAYQTTVRMIVGWFKTIPNAGIQNPAVTDVLDLANVMSGVNRNCFTAVYDKTWEMSQANFYNTSGLKAKVAFKFNFKGRPMTYTSSSNVQDSDFNKVPIVCFITDVLSTTVLNLQCDILSKLAYSE